MNTSPETNEERRMAFPSHPLLEPGVANNWQAIQEIIAPAYFELTGGYPNFRISFDPPRNIEKDTGLVGARGVIIGFGSGRTAMLRCESSAAIAEHYSGLFHELRHLDDQITRVDGLKNLLIQLGFISPYDDRGYGDALRWIQRRFPWEARMIDQCFVVEHMVAESRAELFSLVLSDKVFQSHPIARSIAAYKRKEFFASCDLYSGLGFTFDMCLRRDLLALLAIADHSTIKDAWLSLDQSMSAVALSAVRDLDRVRRSGFSRVVAAGVNRVFRSNYGLRATQLHYDWSGTSKELDSIGDPAGSLYDALAFCAQPDSFRVAADAVYSIRSHARCVGA